jgi:outer membrane immunogenic protein
MIYSKLLGAGALLVVAAMPTTAHAADVIDPVPVSDVWTGPYIGAFGGYTWLDISGEYESDETDDDGPVEGFLVGGQIGYNHQMENIVLGVEADLAYSFADGDLVTVDGEEADTDLNFLGTLRARAGMVFGESDSTLLFVTAGLAVGDFDAEFEGDSDGATHTGYVVGAGLEHMVTESISIKGEYNYMDFNTKDYDDAEGEDISYDGHVVKLGVNFHF